MFNTITMLSSPAQTLLQQRSSKQCAAGHNHRTPRLNSVVRKVAGGDRQQEPAAVQGGAMREETSPVRDAAPRKPAEESPILDAAAPRRAVLALPPLALAAASAAPQAHAVQGSLAGRIPGACTHTLHISTLEAHTHACTHSHTHMVNTRHTAR